MKTLTQIGLAAAIGAGSILLATGGNVRQAGQIIGGIIGAPFNMISNGLGSTPVACARGPAGSGQNIIELRSGGTELQNNWKTSADGKTCTNDISHDTVPVNPALIERHRTQQHSARIGKLEVLST